MQLYKEFTGSQALSAALDFIVDLNVRGQKGRIVRDHKTLAVLVLYTVEGEREADRV